MCLKTGPKMAIVKEINLLNQLVNYYIYIAKIDSITTLTASYTEVKVWLLKSKLAGSIQS